MLATAFTAAVSGYTFRHAPRMPTSTMIVFAMCFHDCLSRNMVAPMYTNTNVSHREARVLKKYGRASSPRGLRLRLV